MTIDYNNIKQIKIINENTKELVGTVRFLDGKWNIKTETPYTNEIVYKRDVEKE
jgi:hypothetical protein